MRKNAPYQPAWLPCRVGSTHHPWPRSTPNPCSGPFADHSSASQFKNHPPVRHRSSHPPSLAFAEFMRIPLRQPQSPAAGRDHVLTCEKSGGLTPKPSSASVSGRSWRGGGVAERAGFENRLAREGHGGSNPPLSVGKSAKSLGFTEGFSFVSCTSPPAIL